MKYGLRPGFALCLTLAGLLAVSVPLTGASRTASIVGSAWNADNSPIRFASVQLRNAEDGKVAALAKANDLGQFAFERVPPGSYVVELLDANGKVEATGHVFTIAPGESVATFVRLGGAKIPWSAAFFSNVAGVATAAAASTGLTALASPGLCSSPPC